MKRYKLLKDLPTAAAGDEFHQSPKGNLVHTESGDLVYTSTTLRKHPDILNKWFEEILEKPKTVWDLQVGTRFWVISEGEVCIGFWGYDDYTPERDIGDVFLTREEAKTELARRKAKQILLRDTNGFRPIRENYYKFYQVYWNPRERKLDTNFSYGIDGTLMFATARDAEESIRKHEKEWKNYLGVEE